VKPAAAPELWEARFQSNRGHSRASVPIERCSTENERLHDERNRALVGAHGENVMNANKIEKMPVRARSGAARAIALTLVLALGGIATNAQAKDLCLNVVNFGTFVARDFKMPAKGKCSPFNGFGEGSLPDAVSGNACTTSDGKRVDFSFVEHFLLPGFDDLIPTHHLVQIAPPTLFGFGTDYSFKVSFGGSNRSDFAEVIRCNPAKPVKQ
jgi:hypothetical protein